MSLRKRKPSLSFYDSLHNLELAYQHDQEFVAEAAELIRKVAAMSQGDLDGVAIAMRYRAQCVKQKFPEYFQQEE